MFCFQRVMTGLFSLVMTVVGYQLLSTVIFTMIVWTIRMSRLVVSIYVFICLLIALPHSLLCVRDGQG